MLADGLIEPPVFVNLLVPIEGDFFPQIRNNLVQNAIAGQLLDQGVEDIINGNVFFSIAFRVMGFKLPVESLDFLEYHSCC